MIATNAHDSALGPCSDENYLEYFKMARDVGRLVIGQSPGFESKAGRLKLRSAMGEIDLPENAATFVVAHDPSARVYTKTCASAPCSIDEISEPETQCLRDHSDFCYFVAVRYGNRTYCTLHEEPPV